MVREQDPIYECEWSYVAVTANSPKGCLDTAYMLVFPCLFTFLLA